MPLAIAPQNAFEQVSSAQPALALASLAAAALLAFTFSLLNKKAVAQKYGARLASVLTLSLLISSALGFLYFSSLSGKIEAALTRRVETTLLENFEKPFAKNQPVAAFVIDRPAFQQLGTWSLSPEKQEEVRQLLRPMGIERVVFEPSAIDATQSDSFFRLSSALTVPTCIEGRTHDQWLLAPISPIKGCAEFAVRLNALSQKAPPSITHLFSPNAREQVASHLKGKNTVVVFNAFTTSLVYFVNVFGTPRPQQYFWLSLANDLVEGRALRVWSLNIVALFCFGLLVALIVERFPQKVAHLFPLAIAAIVALSVTSLLRWNLVLPWFWFIASLTLQTLAALLSSLSFVAARNRAQSERHPEFLNSLIRAQPGLIEKPISAHGVTLFIALEFAGHEEYHSEFVQATNEISEIVRRHGGYVDKVEPYWLMAVFCQTLSSDCDESVDHLEPNEVAATNSAVEILRSPSLRSLAKVRAGLHTGSFCIGNIGSRTAPDLTVLGDGVNFARRLVDASSPGTALLSDTFCEKLGSPDAFDNIPLVKRDFILKNRFETHYAWELCIEN